MNDLYHRLEAALARRYAIEREVGRGAMGTVFLAHDTRHDRRVAIKVLRAELSASTGAVRFLREIEFAAQLQHPHILPLLDSGDAGGTLYYVMPYVEGESLRQRLSRQPQLPIPDAVQVAREVADALAYAHDRGVLHRDIKPENILLTAGHALVADFGLARAVSEADEHLTYSGMGVGTPAYVSPEQASGERALGPSTDVYSLGCVLYEMLCGEPPHTGRTVQAILARKTLEAARPLRTIRETIPAQVENVVLRSVERSPADRYQTAADFREALEEAVRASAVPAPTRRWPRWGAVGLATALLVFAVVTLFAPGARPAPPTIAILPFHVDGVAGDDAIGDELPSRLVTLLSGVSGLRVIGTTSSMQYRPGETPLREIGRDLGADYILAGTVRRDPGEQEPRQLVIRSELTRVADLAVQWTRSFAVSEGLDKLLGVQSQIARQVSETIGVALQSRERELLAEPPTASPEAWDAYRHGVALYRRSARAEDNVRAAQAFERAAARDPRFAEAHAAAAEAYAAAYQSDPKRTHLEQAAGAIERALELDPALPEAHMAVAVFHYVQGQYQQALVAVQRALDARPSYHTARFLRATIPRRQGRWNEAVDNFEQLVALDPRNRISITALAHTLLRLRRYREAQRYFDRAVALDPLTNDEAYVDKAWLLLVSGEGLAASEAVLSEAAQLLGASEIVSQLAQQHPSRQWFGLVRGEWARALAGLAPAAIRADTVAFYLALAAEYAAQRDSARARLLYDSAATVLEARLRAHPDNAVWHSYLGVAYAGSGRSGAAVQAAQRGVALRPIAEDAYYGPESLMLLALTYAMIGDRDAAVRHLRVLLEVPSLYSAEWLRLHPLWRTLRDHRAYAELVRN